MATLRTKKIFVFFMALGTLFVLSEISFAQTKKKKKTPPKTNQNDQAALDAKKKDLQAQIDFDTKQIKNIQRTKTLSLAELVAYNMKISAQESLITEINNEIAQLDLQ